MNYAAEWDEEHAKREMIYDRPLPVVEDFFKDRWRDIPGPTVVDIGCGAGTNTLHLARVGFRVFGFDSSPAAIRRLIDRQFAPTNGRYQYAPRVIVADVTKPWPYRDASMDAALDVRSLENLDEDEARFAYGQLARVLKPGAQFFCLTASEDRNDKWTTCGKVRRMHGNVLVDWLAIVGLDVKVIEREFPRTLEDWRVEAIRR